MSDEANPQEPSWGQTLAIWWSFMWRCTVWSMLSGIVLGAVGGGITGAIGHVEQARVVGGILGYLGSIPASMYAMKVVLGKRYNGFSVRLDKLSG